VNDHVSEFPSESIEPALQRAITDHSATNASAERNEHQIVDAGPSPELPFGDRCAGCVIINDDLAAKPVSQQSAYTKIGHAIEIGSSTQHSFMCHETRNADSKAAVKTE
jgi:hypothetical protein|tara:strand:+ start:419 stop:745 length:327 start_codon:yes stop_codon:yes gene_type:complete